MSDLNPYPTGPYHQGVAGTSYPTDFDNVSQSALAVSPTRNGYYSADGLGDQSSRFPAAPGGQMVPYPGGDQQPYSQAYEQPYSQQYPYLPPSYGPYPPHGQGAYWEAPYDPHRYEANALDGWALGLDIASIVVSCLSFGLILSVSAVIVGVLGMRAASERCASNRGPSIAGVVTGAIGTVVGACYLMLFIVMLFQ